MGVGKNSTLKLFSFGRYTRDIGQTHFGNASEIPTVTVTYKYYITLWYIIFASQILIMHEGNGTQTFETHFTFILNINKFSAILKIFYLLCDINAIK